MHIRGGAEQHWFGEWSSSDPRRCRGGELFLIESSSCRCPTLQKTLSWQRILLKSSLWDTFFCWPAKEHDKYELQCGPQGQWDQVAKLMVKIFHESGWSSSPDVRSSFEIGRKAYASRKTGHSYSIFRQEQDHAPEDPLVVRLVVCS